MKIDALKIVMFLGIFMSLSHCFYISDYNICLFLIGSYMWNYRKFSRGLIVVIYSVTLIYDIMYLFFMARSRALIYEIDSQSEIWEEHYLQSFKITFGLEILLKMMTVILFVIWDPKLKQNLGWDSFYSNFINFFTIK